jgi:CHRD domain
MSRIALRVIALTAVLALLGVVSYAVAGGGTRSFKGKPMLGYAENPDVSTLASGSFKARLSDDGSKLAYELSYSGLEGTVQQAHIHFGKPGVTGGISIWLCGTSPGFVPPTAGIPTCPQSGTVTGEVDATDVVGPAGQGIAAGEFGEILAAMRAGRAYANVHSTKFPGGEIRAQLNNRDGGDDDDEGDDD